MDKLQKKLYDAHRYQKIKERIKRKVISYKERRGKSWVNEKAREWRKKNLLKVRRQDVESLKRLKFRVLTHYGGNKCACVICMEERIECLSIHHINNNGYRERKELKLGSSFQFYRYLERNQYPEGYQTLCMNCQFIKRAEYTQERRLQSKV